MFRVVMNVYCNDEMKRKVVVKIVDSTTASGAADMAEKMLSGSEELISSRVYEY